MGSFYNLLNKDIKELNMVVLSLFIIIFLFSVGFISYKINNSYALFSDSVEGVKTIELAVSNDKIFNYTGDVQEYTVPRDGYYYIELGGAAGGNGKYEDATSKDEIFGAKTSGYIELKAGEKLYIYVGKRGEDINTNCRTSGYEFNGGGIAKPAKDGICGATGGGATDIRLVRGSWDNSESLISRIMVAGAGAGGPIVPARVYSSPYGGTLYGVKSLNDNYQDNLGNPGTQINGGAAPLHSASMKFIPKETIDKDVLFLAVKQFGIAIKYAPKELLDKDIIMVALQVDGSSLEYIPKNLIDKEMILAAVKNKGIAIGSAPKELIDHDIIMAALQENGDALGYIPKELIDREMILTAVKSPGFAIQYVPKSLIDQEISQAAIENDELAIIYIPEEIKKELQKKKKKKKKTKDKLEQTNKETKWKLCLKKKRKR